LFPKILVNSLIQYLLLFCLQNPLSSFLFRQTSCPLSYLKQQLKRSLWYGLHLP